MGSGKTLHILSLPVKPKFIASDTESAPLAKSRIIRPNSSTRNKKIICLMSDSAVQWKCGTFKKKIHQKQVS